MENSNISLKTLYIFLSCTFLVLISNSFKTTATINVRNRTKIVLPLIHQDSILSPFYNPKLYTKDDIRGPLMADEKSTTFLVNVSIGEPPIPQLLALDTGSPLTWVCTKCFPGLSPVYDSNYSSTYNSVSCVSMLQCFDYFDHADCEQDSQCFYKVSYVDDSISRGILATEKFTFETSTGGIVEIPDLAFGCGVDNRGNALKLTGILGLERLNKHSLVSRVSNKFSYCVGNISDPYYMYNQLILGDGAIIEGDLTTMVIKGGHYFVKLEGVSVGEKKLEIDQGEFDFNVVIDSGTTLTYLRRGVFDQLKYEVSSLMDGLLEPKRVYSVDIGERLCYIGNLVRDLKGFPIVTLHFGEGADLSLEVEGIFKRVNDEFFCMAVDVSTDDLNVIGAYAQQYYNIGFDLNTEKISFQKIECEFLED